MQACCLVQSDAPRAPLVSALGDSVSATLSSFLLSPAPASEGVSASLACTAIPLCVSWDTILYHCLRRKSEQCSQVSLMMLFSDVIPLTLGEPQHAPKMLLLYGVSPDWCNLKVSLGPRELWWSVHIENEIFCLLLRSLGVPASLPP